MVFAEVPSAANQASIVEVTKILDDEWLRNYVITALKRIPTLSLQLTPYSTGNDLHRYLDRDPAQFDSKVLKLFLDFGASVNLRDSQGRTPLIHYYKKMILSIQIWEKQQNSWYTNIQTYTNVKMLFYTE